MPERMPGFNSAAYAQELVDHMRTVRNVRATQVARGLMHAFFEGRLENEQVNEILDVARARREQIIANRDQNVPLPDVMNWPPDEPITVDQNGTWTPHDVLGTEDGQERPRDHAERAFKD